MRIPAGLRRASLALPGADPLNYYCTLNPYIPLFERFRLGQVQRLSKLISPADIRKPAFYHEWLKPAGDFTHGAGVALLRDDRRMLRVTADIPERLGHLEAVARVRLAAAGVA